MKKIEINVQEVPSFGSVGEVLVAQGKKQNNEKADLYPRDGSLHLDKAEELSAELIGIPSRNLLLYTSGMTAVIDVAEFIRPTTGTVIVRNNALYSQSEWFFGRELPERGVRSLAVDVSGSDSVGRVMDRNEKVDLLFLETVGNEPDMKMPDVEAILTDPKVLEKDPLVALDITLPTSAGMDYLEIARKSGLRVVFIQSATKFFGLNQVLAGMVYSENTEIMDELRDRRKKRGMLLSQASAQVYENIIVPTPEELKKRVDQTLQNTFALAQAADEVSDPATFKVVYPNLSSHENSKYANRVMPKGAAPVFFILPNLESSVDHLGIARALWSNKSIRELSRLGQSFGFSETRLWPDDRFPVLRVAGGTENEGDIKRLTNEFQKVLGSLKDANSTSFPTGDSVSLDKISIPVRLQTSSQACGQSVLEMAGYSVEGLQIGEEGVSAFDVFEITGDFDDQIARFNSGTLSDQDIYMANGTKSSTGNPHWFLIVGNMRQLVNPEDGIVDPQKYLEEEISEVNAVVRIPLGPRIQRGA